MKYLKLYATVLIICRLVIATVTTAFLVSAILWLWGVI